MKPNFHRSFETNKIFEALEWLKPGDSVGYKSLNDLVGFDILKFKQKLNYVRDKLKRSGRAVIELAPEGLYRLTDAEVVNGHSPRYKRRVSMSALRASSALASVEYDQLSTIDRTTHNAHQAGFGAIRLFTRVSTHKRIAGEIEKTSVVIPPRDLLKLFSK
jgi:hypothetical protein